MRATHPPHCKRAPPSDATIARATGACRADLAARVLPRVVSRRIAPPHDRHLRLHLTGAGGGTWTVPLDPAGTVPAAARPAAVVVLDVVEFCRLAADRRDPGRIAVEVQGDTALAREFLAAVPTLAPVP